MAITSAICTSYKKEILEGVHASGDTYKVLLLKAGASGTYGAGTTNVGTPGSGSPSSANVGTDEVSTSGTGYTSGGETLTVTISSSGTTAYLGCDDIVWTPSNISADGAVIYNASKSNKAVCVISFEGTKTSTGADFIFDCPVTDSTHAVLQLP